MPAFCGNCGAPLDGLAAFCGGCGARAGQAPASPSPMNPVAPMGPPAASGSSALKVVLIIVGVVIVLGVIAIAGIYYTAHRYVTMAEEATGIKASDVVRGVRDAAKAGGGGREHGSNNRDGCLLLTKDEASSILGIQVERISGKSEDGRSGEHCSFFVKPGVAAEHEKSPAALASEADKSMQGMMDEIKLHARAAVEAERHGEAPYFTFTVERENGKIACAGIGLANGLSGVEAITGGKSAEPLGVGDQAVMGIGESMMCVSKGSSAITLELSQIAGARAIGIAIAQTILPRL